MADLYAAITDDTVNRIINLLHARVPFLFNYVAPSVRLRTNEAGQLMGFEELWLTCSEVVPVPPPGVPRYRRIPSFELPGIAVKLPCSIQLIDLNFDFHPSDTVTMPAELSPPLASQRFVIQAMIQFGLACVPPSVASTPRLQTYTHDIPITRLPVLPVESLTCFLIEIFVTGHLVVVETGTPPTQQIKLEIDGLEIKDIAPSGLEQAVECYLVAMLKGAILPELVLALQTIPINTLGIGSVTPTLTRGLPHNPALEQNELRVWLDLAFT
jgi:hypothetical protein